MSNLRSKTLLTFFFALFLVLPVLANAQSATVEDITQFINQPSTGSSTTQNWALGKYYTGTGTLQKLPNETYLEYLLRMNWEEEYYAEKARSEAAEKKERENILKRNPVVSQVVPQNTSQSNLLDMIVPGSFFGGFADKPLSRVLNQVFYAGLVVAVVLALVMVVRGGIQYMTSESEGGKESGRNVVTAAAGGLVLAFSSVLILNSINPTLTSLSLTVSRIKEIEGIQLGSSTVSSGGRTEGGNAPNLEGKTPFYTITPDKVAIDTDGSNPPPFNDPDYQNQTSKPGLDANVDNYVVVPLNSDIPLGTPVYMENKATGVGVWGIVGDRGPGFGEMSLNAARELGVWKEGMGNSANTSNKITYTFYK